MLFNTNSAIIQPYHGEMFFLINFQWDDDEVALYKGNTLSWIFIVLAHWNNSPRIHISPHSDTTSWFRANQSLLFLLNAVSLSGKQQIPISSSLVWPDWGPNQRSIALEANMLTITPLMRLNIYQAYNSIPHNIYQCLSLSFQLVVPKILLINV